METQSEELGHNTPDLHPAERDSRPGVQQHAESALECIFGGGQGGGDAYDLVQPSRGSRGKR